MTAVFGTPQTSEQEYETAGLALEVAGQGPVLCLGPILSSYPPRCGGPALRNWDWDAVPHRESAGRTTWADVKVRGTFDGTAFTVTALLDELTGPAPRPPRPDLSPACPEPEILDPAVPATAWTEPPGFDDEVEVVGVWMSHQPPAVNVVVRPGAAARAREAVRAAYGGPLCLVERDRPTRRALRSVQAAVTARLVDHGFLGVGTDEARGVVGVTLVLATPELQQQLDAEFGAGVVELYGRLTPVSRSRPPRDGGG